MKNKRLLYLECLKAISPALTDKDMVAVFTCFCFCDDKVYAYDDTLYMEVPLQSGFTGAVKGKPVMAWLSAISAREFDMSMVDDQLILKAGRSTNKQPVMFEDDFLFDQEELKAKGKRIDPDIFKRGLTRCSLSIGENATAMHMTGVTLSVKDGVANFYSTDNLSASHAQYEVDSKSMKVVIPPKFCSLLAKMKESPTSVIISKDFIRCKFSSGLLIQARTIEGDADSLESYQQVFEANTLDSDGAEHEYFEIPARLKKAMERVSIAVAEKQQPAKFRVTSGKLYIEASSSSMGSAKEVLSIKGHPDVAVEAPAEHVAKALDDVTTIRIVENNSILMSNEDGFTYLVGVVNSSEPEYEVIDE